MNGNSPNRVSLVLVAALLAVAALAVVQLTPAHAGSAAATGAVPRYTVVETQGHNLIVTDNETNTLYFYTTDPDKEIGSDLKIRGSVDLTQVGKPVVKPVTHKLEKSGG